MPDEFEFTLEALSPFDSDPANFKIGSVIPYRLTIHASHVETDVQVQYVKIEQFLSLSEEKFSFIRENFVVSYQCLKLCNL